MTFQSESPGMAEGRIVLDKVCAFERTNFNECWIKPLTSCSIHKIDQQETDD